MGIGKRRNENGNGKKAFENISVFTVRARDAFSNLYILSLLEIYLSFVCGLANMLFWICFAENVWYASLVVYVRVSAHSYFSLHFGFLLGPRVRSFECTPNLRSKCTHKII